MLLLYASEFQENVIKDMFPRHRDVCSTPCVFDKDNNMFNAWILLHMKLSVMEVLTLSRRLKISVKAITMQVVTRKHFFAISDANASELLENREEMFPLYWQMLLVHVQMTV